MKEIRVVRTQTTNKSSGRTSRKQTHSNPQINNRPQINLLQLNNKGSLLQTILKRGIISTKERRKLAPIVKRMGMKNIIFMHAKYVMAIERRKVNLCEIIIN